MLAWRSRTRAPRRGARTGPMASRPRSTGSTSSTIRSSGTAHGRRFRRQVAPGERVEIELSVTAPRPPGAYRLAFDLVEEHRFWFEEIGCTPLKIDVDVAPRISSRRLGVRVHGGADPGTAAALAAQEEEIVEDDAVAVAHLVAGARPGPNWSTVVLDAHAEGWEASGRRSSPAAEIARSNRGMSTAAEILALRTPSCSLRCSRVSNRRSTSACPPIRGRKGCSTPAPRSDFRRDPIVDRVEHGGSGRQCNQGLEHEIDEVCGRRYFPQEEG